MTAGELRQQIAAGYDTPAGLKRKCRVGMGRCQGRYCAAVVARMTTDKVDEFGLFAPRPPAKPVPIHALSVEQAEWSGHKDFVPPDMARPRETEPLPAETVDTLVIGGGVAGSCLAYWLAHEGIEALVVERDEVNLQASGANAGIAARPAPGVRLCPGRTARQSRRRHAAAWARPRWRCGRRSSATPARTSR